MVRVVRGAGKKGVWVVKAAMKVVLNGVVRYTAHRAYLPYHAASSKRTKTLSWAYVSSTWALNVGCDVCGLWCM